jgi:hypothetical protein
MILKVFKMLNVKIKQFFKNEIFYANFRFLGCIFVLMLLLSFVPLSLFFLASFLYILLNNDEFRKGKNDKRM